MIQLSIRRGASTAALTILLLCGGAITAATTAAAVARPDPGDTDWPVGLTETADPAYRTSLTGELSLTGDPSFTSPNCPLRRLGTQLVRCDLLTGAGVAAPPFIPEWTP